MDESLRFKLFYRLHRLCALRLILECRSMHTVLFAFEMKLFHRLYRLCALRLIYVLSFVSIMRITVNFRMLIDAFSIICI